MHSSHFQMYFLGELKFLPKQLQITEINPYFSRATDLDPVNLHPDLKTWFKVFVVTVEPRQVRQELRGQGGDGMHKR